MIIQSLQIKRFRCFWDETIECDFLTALVGPNGSGKSTFLRALELFYVANPKIDRYDFFAEDTSKQIEIAVTFTELGPEELSRFDKYVENNQLRVIRVFSLADGKLSHKYHGSRLQNPDFANVRMAINAKEAKSNYDSLRANPRYDQLPTWANREQALAALIEWEAAHPAECSRQIDDGQFFGFTEVAQGYLGRYSKFILIPAVRDASSDAEEGKGSAITEIMDLVVRSTLASHEELHHLREDAKERYDQIVDPARLEKMVELEHDLTQTLGQYAPGGAVHLGWLSTGGIEIQLPKAEVRLTEDGYRSSVVRTGHGLQRAFILTMLQYLATARASQLPSTQTSSATQPSPQQESSLTSIPARNTVLAIEEPELYQHPTRQRHLASILLQPATAGTTAQDLMQKTQVIYSTHSPAFVGLERFNQIRLFRKRATAEGPKCSSVARVSLELIARGLWEVHGRPGEQFTEATLKPRLKSLMTPWLNEGFFADVVVLVEGEEDRAAILGYADTLGHNLDGSGISLIPCMGKHNLDRAALIFDSLGIPVYLIWDGDEGDADADPQFNRCLLRIVGAAEEDFPDRVEDTFACFRRTLNATLRHEIGEDMYEGLLLELQREHALKRKDALKSPMILQEFIRRANARSRSSLTIEKIVERIVKRRY